MSKPAPSAAIVIPSHGRPARLAECLAALARLEGGPWRVIVVDDGSPEALAPVCAAAGEWVTCLRQEKAGPAAARNAGIAAADDAETILFTDDDCRPRPGWARALLASQAGEPMRLVGGHVANGLPGNLFSETSQSIQTHLYESYGRFDGPDAFFASNNLCARRVDLLSLGGFDTSFVFASEDRDLSERWRAAGGALHYAPEAVVDHHHALSLAGFARQHWQYGRGGRRYHVRRDASHDPAMFANPPGFYAALLFHPLKAGAGPRNLAMSALVGAAHAFQFAGYLAERRAERRRG